LPQPATPQLGPKTLDKPLTLITHLPSRLLFVLTPKCGSTSLISTFLILAGLPEAARAPRSFRRTPDSTAEMATKGLSIIDGTLADLIAARAANPGFRLLAVVRDPTDRLISNYFNKLNRYAKRHARLAYVWGKLCQLAEGPKAWPDVTRGNRHMQRLLGFEHFLSGLGRHGTEFDIHYAAQSGLLGLQQLTYDRLFRLETLDQDLLPGLAASGMPPECLDRLTALPRMNRTREDPRQSTLLTPGVLRCHHPALCRGFRGTGLCAAAQGCHAVTTRPPERASHGTLTRSNTDAPHRQR